MPRPVATPFTKFEFTNEEFFAATRFSETQLMLIQTLLADAAIRRINLKVNPSDLSSLQEEAEVKGEIGAYQHLLNLFTDTPMPEASEAQKQADVTGSSSKSDPNPEK